MALFNWSDKYKLNIREIDDQHRQLFDIMNKIHDLITSEELQDNDEVINEMIGKLLLYTKNHLNYEESLLEKYEYPESDAHKVQHEAFCIKIAKYRALLDNHEKIDPLDLLSFIIEWLTSHIIETDFQYRDFLLEKGVN